MKTVYKYIMCALVAMLGFTACDKNDDTALNLSGNCMIEEIALD